MPYRFATESRNYADLAAGSVLHNFPGHPAFPIRLASETFQRCLAHLAEDNITRPITLYDPCCGGAYLLTTLAFEHWQEIGTLIGSDIDADALKLAEANLSLLTLDGLNQRLATIKNLFEQFGKSSHAEAIKSGTSLKDRLAKLIKSHRTQTCLFRADSTNSHELQTNLPETTIDLVITDIPYGEKASWHGDFDGQQSPVWHLLEVLRTILAKHSIVAIIADKKQKVAHEHYERLSRFQIGKRRIFILKQNN